MEKEEEDGVEFLSCIYSQAARVAAIEFEGVVVGDVWMRRLEDISSSVNPTSPTKAS